MIRDVRVHSSSIRAGALGALLVCLFLAASCAYFNTLYNARRIYRETEERREQGKSGEREMRESYEEVITKCAKVVRDYPDSRWVDDALFLMGKALVRKGDIDKGIRKFVELMTNFPESDYVPKSIYWLGLAYYEKGDSNHALVYTDRFLDEYPKNELRNKVMFLAGDVSRELEQEEEALSYYSRVAEEASDGDVIDEATLKTAELFYEKGDWEKAASAYLRVLRKGIPWARKYEISLALGDCYIRMEKCAEALEVYDRLMEEIVTAKEKPPVELGRASSYVCMDSLETALSIFESVTGEFPRSSYSAEAFYHIGVIYHERLDSLQRAQEAFSKVAGEYADSEFAPRAIDKSTSIKRLIELEQSPGEGASGREQMAEKRFLAAEIQLTQLGEIDLALEKYTALLDSFPKSSYAPQAAYAIAWIHDREKQDRDRAIELYRRVISLYPRSPQALGSIERLGTLGALELRERMQAVVDSALVDTTGLVEEPEGAPREGAVDSLAAPPSVGQETRPIAPDSLGAPRPGTGELAPSPDSTRAFPPASPFGTRPDTSRISPPDTVEATRDSVSSSRADSASA